MRQFYIVLYIVLLATLTQIGVDLSYYEQGQDKQITHSIVTTQENIPVNVGEIFPNGTADKKYCLIPVSFAPARAVFERLSSFAVCTQFDF